MRMRTIIGASTICLVSAVAHAADQCQQYVGRLLTPIAFEDAIAPYTKLAVKGEFETTAQYQARRDAALMSGSTGPLVITKTPEDRKYFEYDADRQKLRVLAYAFDNTGFFAWEAFYAAGLYGKFDVDTTDNLDVVIRQEEKPTGTYEATNAFGAKTQVVKVTRTVDAILEGKLPRYGASLFPAANRSPFAVGDLELSPQDAQALKPLLQIGFVVLPKEPYFTSGSTEIGKTTLQNPRQITMDFRVLIADIQCGLLMDGTFKVLAAYPTL